MAAAAFDPVEAGGQDVPLVRTMPLAHSVRVPRSSERGIFLRSAPLASSASTSGTLVPETSASTATHEARLSPLNWCSSPATIGQPVEAA